MFLTSSMNRTDFRQYLPTPETNKDFLAFSLLSVKPAIQSMCSTAWLQNKPVSLKEKAAVQMLFALWYGSMNVSGCSSSRGHKPNQPGRGKPGCQPAPVLPPDRGMLCALGFSPGESTPSALSAAGPVPWQQYRGFRVQDLIGTSVGWCSALENKNIPIKLLLWPGIFEGRLCYSLFVPAGVKKKSQWYERIWLASFRKWEFWVLLTNAPYTLKYSVGHTFSAFFALTEEQLANKQVIIIISYNKIYDNYSSNMNNGIFLTTWGWNQRLQFNNQVYSSSKGKTKTSMEKKVPFYKRR